jgi:hypothetical protein
MHVAFENFVMAWDSQTFPPHEHGMRDSVNYEKGSSRKNLMSAACGFLRNFRKGQHPEFVTRVMRHEEIFRMKAGKDLYISTSREHGT